MQLDRYSSPVTSTSSGVLIPKYDAYFTEGGKPAAKQSNKEFTSVGTVISVSPAALSYIEQEWKGLTLVPGQRVWLQPNAASPKNQFLIDRDVPITQAELTGESPFVLVPPQSIEALLDEFYTIEFE